MVGNQRNRNPLLLYYLKVFSAEESWIPESDFGSGDRSSALSDCSRSYRGVSGMVCQLCASRGGDVAGSYHCDTDGGKRF